MNALLFLYREVFGKEIGYANGVVRAKRPTRLPVVLTRQEVRAILALLEGPEWIMGMLLYGAGLRLTECLRLRVKDVDFSRNEIRVRSGKGDKDRVTMLPFTVTVPLQGTWSASSGIMNLISRTALQEFPCPMRWPGNIRTP